MTRAKGASCFFSAINEMNNGASTAFVSADLLGYKVNLTNTRMDSMEVDDAAYLNRNRTMEGLVSQVDFQRRRRRPSRCMTVCLGLLSTVLLAGNIGQFIYYEVLGRVESSSRAGFQFQGDTPRGDGVDDDAPAAKRSRLEARLSDLTEERGRLQQRYSALATERDELNASVHSLREDRDRLQASYVASKQEGDRLQANYAASKQEGDRLQASYVASKQEGDRLQASYDASKQEGDRLQQRYSALATERDELNASVHSLREDRDRLQASYDASKQEGDRLQASYDASKQEGDRLQASHDLLQSSLEGLRADHENLKAAKDRLQTNYQNLQREKDELQSSSVTLTATRDRLLSSYALLQTASTLLTRDRERLQSGYSSLQRDQEQLQSRYRLLAKGKDELEKKIGKVRGRPCQPGWRRFDVSCYFISAEKKNWTSGRDECVAQGSDLVSIEGRDEQAFVNALLPEDASAWIGLTDAAEEGTWTWTDGTPVNATFWQAGQPNDVNGGQDCGEMLQRSSGVGEWNDDGCFAVQRFICKR